jgi:hypothetical protein
MKKISKYLFGIFIFIIFNLSSVRASNITHEQFNELSELTLKASNVLIELEGSAKYLSQKSGQNDLFECYVALENLHAKIESEIRIIFYVSSITAGMIDPVDEKTSQEILNTNLDIFQKILPMYRANDLVIIRHHCHSKEISTQINSVIEVWDKAEYLFAKLKH